MDCARHAQDAFCRLFICFFLLQFIDVKHLPRVVSNVSHTSIYTYFIEK